MYHIGVIQNVLSPRSKGMVSSDSSTQAVVRMWDENLLILGVDKKISARVKKGDYVLADYSPLAPESGHRRLCITKIIPSEMGRLVWNTFQGEFERRKNIGQQPQPQPGQMRYIR